MMSTEQIMNELFKAAEAEDWDKVDKDLVPALANFDGDRIAEFVLGRVRDENPNIRDVVATSIVGIEIKSPELLEKAFGEMRRMATSDSEKFPAGRAMSFLLKFQNEPKFTVCVSEAVVEFKRRVKEKNWTASLQEAIPVLRDIF